MPPKPQEHRQILPPAQLQQWRPPHGLPPDVPQARRFKRRNKLILGGVGALAAIGLIAAVNFFAARVPGTGADCSELAGFAVADVVEGAGEWCIDLDGEQRPITFEVQECVPGDYTGRSIIYASGVGGGFGDDEWQAVTSTLQLSGVNVNDWLECREGDDYNSNPDPSDADPELVVRTTLITPPDEAGCFEGVRIREPDAADQIDPATLIDFGLRSCTLRDGYVMGSQPSPTNLLAHDLADEIGNLDPDDTASAVANAAHGRLCNVDIEEAG